jgi:thiamine-phosphate diphosphorylase
LTLPRLHVVTDDRVLARPGFAAIAETLLDRGGAAVALHLRGHRTGGRRLEMIGMRLVERARVSGARLLVNDRADIALAIAADGVELGRRSLPVVQVRLLLGPRWIGYSAHGVAEAVAAERAGTDFILMGTIYQSGSHPDAAAAGIGLVREAAAAVRIPVLAIGGVEPERLAEIRAAGAWGAAVLAGVWNAADPAVALGRYLEGMTE